MNMGILKRRMGNKTVTENLPTITCFMLSYNKFKYIYEAIDSILMQTYPRIELAIFDDCSENFPRKEIEQYIESHKRENIVNVIIYQNPENQGTVKNFNNVIEKTTGKYLLGAGIDDLLYDPYVFEKVVNFFEETGAGIVTCYKEEISKEGEILRRTPSAVNARRIKRATAHELYKMIATGVAVAGAGTYYARHIFEQVGLFDERYRLQEDGPFFLKATREGHKIYFLEIVAVKYRMGAGISSGKELHPYLKVDINNMLQNEVVPYIKEFNFWERRRVYYQVERFRLPKQLTGAQKLKLILKYFDVVVYRRVMAR